MTYEKKGVKAGIGRERSLRAMHAQKSVLSPHQERALERHLPASVHTLSPNCQILMPFLHSVTDMSCHQKGEISNKVILSVEETLKEPTARDCLFTTLPESPSLKSHLGSSFHIGHSSERLSLSTQTL